jgi:hypothetical protein
VREEVIKNKQALINQVLTNTSRTKWVRKMVGKERGYQGKKLTLLCIYIYKWTKNHEEQSTKEHVYTRD